jgi:cytoskeleton protein RodZ
MNEFETSVTPGQTIGEPLRLRQAREAAGLHIAALAAALKVPVKKLEALEAGRYEELPDMTFARALAASACRQLKIDPAFVLEQIPGAVRPPLGGATPPINAPFKSDDGGSSGGGMAWLSRPVVWGVGLLLLAAIAMAVLPQGWVNRFQTGSAPEPEPLITTPDLVIESVVPSVSDDAPLVPSVSDDAPQANPPSDAASEQAAEATASGVLAETPVVPTPAAAEPTPAASGGELLIIRAVNESWIEVINGSGVRVVQQVLKPGEALDFSTAPPYSVVVGRADAVQVTVRGQPLDVMPYARNNVARFEVK